MKLTKKILTYIINNLKIILNCKRETVFDEVNSVAKYKSFEEQWKKFGAFFSYQGRGSKIFLYLFSEKEKLLGLEKQHSIGIF